MTAVLSFIANALVRKEITNIEEIARMPPVQGGDDLACVKVGE